MLRKTMELEKFISKMETLKGEEEYFVNNQYLPDIEYELGIADNIGILLKTDFNKLIEHITAKFPDYDKKFEQNFNNYFLFSKKKNSVELTQRFMLSPNIKIFENPNFILSGWLSQHSEEHLKFIKQYDALVQLHPGKKNNLTNYDLLKKMVKSVAEYGFETKSPLVVATVPRKLDNEIFKNGRPELDILKKYYGIYNPK